MKRSYVVMWASPEMSRRGSVSEVSRAPLAIPPSAGSRVMSCRFCSVLLALACLSAAGCGYKSRALPVRSVHEYSNKVAFEGVQVAATAFDKATSGRVLNRAPNRSGFVPVLVALENSGEERAVVDGANITLETGRGNVRPRTATEVVVKKCQKSVGAHVIFFGWLAGLSAADYNRKMAEDWRAKELPSQVVLEPHSSTSRLLFYAVPRSLTINDATLSVPVALGNRPGYEEVRCALP